MSGVDVLAVMGRSLVEGLPLSRVDDMTEARAAVAELITCTDRYLKADRKVGDLKEFGGPDYALTREWREATCERSNSWCALNNALARVAGGAE